MPGIEFYAGENLPNAIRKLAMHHADAPNRHISFFEKELLFEVAFLLDRIRDVSTAMDWKGQAVPLELPFPYERTAHVGSEGSDTTAPGERADQPGEAQVDRG